MKRRTLVLVSAVVVLAVAGASLYARRQSGAGAAAQAAAAKPAGSAAQELPMLEFVASDVLTVAPGVIARSIPITGSLRPVNQTVVKSKVAGDIRELLVREGTAVKAGQLIARIDSMEFDWRLRERQAQLRSAQAQLEQARRTMENNRQLLERNFISQSAYDTAGFSYEAALGNRDAAQAQLTLARRALSDTDIVAPMAGIIAERFAQAGEKVSPDNRIVSIIDLSRMEIEAPVPAAEISAIRVGQMIDLTIDGIDQPQTAQVVRISPGTQAGTRSVPVYLGLDNRDPRIRAGLFAQGLLSVGSRSGVLTIPQSALRDAAGRQFVYLIEGDRLVEREVKAGVRDESAPAIGGGMGIVEIVAGLKAGERIIAVNLGPLRVGSQVSIAAATAVAAPAPAAPARNL